MYSVFWPQPHNNEPYSALVAAVYPLFWASADAVTVHVSILAPASMEIGKQCLPAMAADAAPVEPEPGYTCITGSLAAIRRNFWLQSAPRVIPVCTA